jgi:hypothetical protein
MSQKDLTRGNTERAQGTEKLKLNANDGKHKRKSQNKQKGENKPKKSKNCECDTGPNATKQTKSPAETAEKEPGRVKEERPKPADSKK